MPCPSCKYQLHKFTVTTNQGGKFEVDHCGMCGGTWFDPYEINRIPYHEVVRLAHETVRPKKPLTRPSILKCPKCHLKLKDFEEDVLPRHVKFFRCQKCHGIWATQKALEKFKKTQEGKVSNYQKKKGVFPSLSSVFIPVLSLSLLIIFTFITLKASQDTRENRLQANYIIENLTVEEVLPGKVAISFRTKNPVLSTITYGPTKLELQKEPISEKPTSNHSIILRNLSPNTLYTYQIILTDQQGRSFTTEEKVFNVSKRWQN